MREIKFRAWHKTGENTEPTMTYFNLEQGYGLNTNFFDAAFNKRHGVGAIMQFTGLKDKNGKEIYEGDVIKVPDDWSTFGMMAGEIREVYFKDGGFRLKPKIQSDIMRGHWLEDDGIFEVIGNIYENPELICNP